MGLFDKVKNLFTEEVEVEEKEEKVVKEEKPEEKEEIQKEMIQVEIPSPTKSRTELHEHEEEKKEEYKFPFFDDNDFDNIEIEKPKKSKRAEKKQVYNPPKEEKKIFKPSPIISPVYGFLDKDYHKDEIKTEVNNYNPKKATVDEIRDRAYGSLESDIETTLFGNNRVLFDEKENKDELEEEINSEEKVIENIENYDSHAISEKPRHEEVKDDELTDLLEAEMSKPDAEEKKPKKSRKISDKELFNLIDSMYDKEEK